MLPGVDAVRIGRVVRAIRQRRRWRQADLARRAGVSQSLIARVERGGGDRLTLATLERILAALGTRLNARVDWNGEVADRLLDAEHAQLVEAVVEILRRGGWEPVPEVTFAVYGERGSIDVLAWHVATRTLLVVEVKSVVPDVQATVATFDRKERLADRVARARGWKPLRIASVLVVAESSTNRRRIATHGATFASRFTHDTRAGRRFISEPATSPGPLRGLWFLSRRTGAGGSRRGARVRVAR